MITADNDDLQILISFPLGYTDDDLQVLTAVDPKIRVCLCPYVEPTHVRLAQTYGDYRSGPNDGLVTDELRCALAKTVVLMGLDVPHGIRSLAPQLRWIQRIGAGVGDLAAGDIPADVVVTSAAGVSAASMSEWVIGRMLAHWKRFEQSAHLQQQHKWDSTEARGRTLKGSTLVIVGMGAIGAAIAERAKPFGVRVLGVRRHPVPSPLAELVVGPDELLAVLVEADAVVVCAPATTETDCMFGAGAFAAMKPGAFFCNVARGTLVDEKALVSALHSGQIGAAVLDVTVDEPLPADSPLWDVPRLTISPHASASMDRAKTDLLTLFAENLKRWTAGAELINVVDLRGRGY